MGSNYVVIISHTGAGILHNKDQAIGLKRFFPNPGRSLPLGRESVGGTLPWERVSQT